MSLPLSRRIARTALLLAAGAAPLAGAAGSASAVELPKAGKLDGAAALDRTGVGQSADQAAQQAAPAVDKTAGKETRQAGRTVTRTTGTAGGLAAYHAGQLKRPALPSFKLPKVTAPRTAPTISGGGTLAPAPGGVPDRTRLPGTSGFPAIAPMTPLPPDAALPGGTAVPGGGGFTGGALTGCSSFWAPGLPG